jgi:hypothetical protein
MTPVERTNEWKKKNAKEFKINSLLFSTKARAKKLGVEFTLTHEWLKEKVNNGVCELSDVPFSFDATASYDPFTPSICRLDPTKGFIPSNSKVVVWMLAREFGGDSIGDVIRVNEGFFTKLGYKWIE